MIAIVLILIGIIIIFTSGVADLYYMFIITGLIVLVVSTVWEAINEHQKKKNKSRK